MLKTRERIELFLVNVTVIEGRHFPKKYKYSAVHVRVGNKKKCTPICFTSESPYFNEFYVFEFSTTMEQFLDTSITLTAFRPRRRLLSRKIIGYVTLDAATVWSAEDHQFYHKWAILLPPVKDVKMAVRGFLKVDIAIIRKGEKFKIPIIDIQATDEIEGNLLQTHSYTAERLRANYTFIVYYGIAFGKGKYSDLKYTVETERDLPKIYVEILFAGRKGRTSTIKGNSNPVWNESIVIPEYFPPLCQRIRINVFNRDKYSRTLISSRIVDLSLICNYDEPGFLPTFGPTFFHFYVKRNKNETYVGKILIAFYTNLPLNESDVVKHVEVKKTSGIREGESSVGLLWIQWFYLVTLTFIINLINYYGNDIMIYSENIADCCYNLEFIGTDTRFQKGLSLIIQRSQRPCLMTVGNFAPLSIATSFAMMRATYSYFMVLYNSRQK